MSHVGAEVRLIDVDPATYNVDPKMIPSDLDGLVAVHYAGLPMDLSGLRYRPRIVIEDAAHALGARTGDGPVGNCAHSDMTAFSFHPLKSITSGEGGAVTTNSEVLVARLRRFRNHGFSRIPSSRISAFQAIDPGFNLRMSELHAALGRSQLRRIDSFLSKRRLLAERYDKLLIDSLAIRPPKGGPSSTHARHIYPVLVDKRDAVVEAMRDAGIGVQIHYVPMSVHSAYFSPQLDQQPTAARISFSTMSLPLFAELTFDDQDRVIAELNRSLGPPTPIGSPQTRFR